MPTSVLNFSNPLTIVLLLLLAYMGLAFTVRNSKHKSASFRLLHRGSQAVGLYSREWFSFDQHHQRHFEKSSSSLSSSSSPPSPPSSPSSSSVARYDTDEQGHYVFSARHLKPRYTGPSETDMTKEQRQIRDQIVASRPRTGLAGPFGPWLAVPNIAQPAQALGKACRYDTSLSFRESDLVILLTGARMRSPAEFDIHVGEALKAGISMPVITAIPRDAAFSLTAVRERVVPLLDVPENENRDREKAIVLFTAKLLEDCTVSERQYEATKKILGGKDSVLVEITSIVGYYTYVAFTLNVFQIPSK